MTRHLDEAVLEAVADFYNDAVGPDPSNPPTRRAVAEAVGLRSSASAQSYLDEAEARGLLVFPLRRSGRRGA